MSTRSIALAVTCALLVLGCRDKKTPPADPPVATAGNSAATRDAAPPPVAIDAATPAPTRLARVSLSAAARELLRAPMQRHIEDVASVLWSAIMLERDRAAKAALQLAATPRVTKPDDMPDDDFAALFPSEFFALEGAMLTAAAAVEPATHSDGTDRLSSALEQLTLTCVACHDVYVNLGAADAASPTAPIAPLPEMAPPKLTRDDELGDEARMLLQHWMGRHGKDVEQLLWSAITLDYDETYAIAGDLAEQLAGTSANIEERSGTVSAQFQSLHGEFEQRLARIAEAAMARDAAATGKAFATMTTTCLRCHQVYLGLKPN